MGKTFWTDLTEGHKAEEYICSELKGEFPTLHTIEGKSIHYDLIDDDGYTIEVKLDKRSEESENIAIEYEHRGEPAGIFLSRAMEWILVYYLAGVGKVYSRIKRVELKAYIKNNWQYFRKFEGVGDKSSIVLINTQLFADTFSYHKILDKGQGKV